MPTLSLAVRPVNGSDWMGVWAIEQGLPHPWAIDEHRAFMKPDRQCTYCAAGGGRVFGFVSVVVMPRYVEVVRVGVDPDRRRVGVGRGLLASLGHWFLTPKRSELHAVVGERDVGAQLFLRACGWKCTKTIGWGGADDEYLFVRGLT